MYMKKQMILLLMILSLSLKTYSNDTTKLNLREVTKYLAEGVECKEILIVRNKQIRLRDSLIYNLTTAVNLHKDKDSIQTLKYNSLKLDNDVCNEQYNKQGNKYIKAKKVNRVLTISNVVFIIGLMVLL